MTTATPDVIFHNGRITTLDRSRPRGAVAVKDGRFVAVGDDAEVLLAGAAHAARRPEAPRRPARPVRQPHARGARRPELQHGAALGRRALAGRRHGHARCQVAITPAPQWVVGGFTEHQFAEKRACPPSRNSTPSRPTRRCSSCTCTTAPLLNGAALRAVGYNKTTPNPPGGEILRDAQGNPTGCCWPSPTPPSCTPRWPRPEVLRLPAISTRHFMRELNRLGVTGVIDAGGGFQNYPDDYAVIQRLADDNQMTVRLAYNLFTQKPKQEKEDFSTGPPACSTSRARTTSVTTAPARCWCSRPPTSRTCVERPDMPPEMEGELEEVVRAGAEPLALAPACHHDETIARALDVFEKVHRDTPLTGLNWFFDHAETISDKSIDRIAALGGGIAVQHRMAYQGEYFIERARRGEATPPVAKMLARGVKVSAGTDATRVASYNPWVSLSWMVTGKTAAARASSRAQLPGPRNRAAHVDRERGLVLQRGRRAAASSRASWPTHRAGQGLFQLRRGRDLADLGPDRGRRPRVHGAGEFGPLDDNPLPPAMPDWSPTPVRRLRRPGATRTAPAAIAGSQHGGLVARHRARHEHARAQAQAPSSDLSGFLARWAAPAGPSEGRRHERNFRMGTAARRRGASVVWFGRDPFPGLSGCVPPICRAAW